MKIIPIEAERSRHPHRRLIFPLSLLLALLSCNAPVRAAVLHEGKIGVLYHDIGFWGGSGKEEGIDFNAELIFSPSIQLMGGKLRPNLGISLNSSGATSKLYGGGVWEYIGSSSWFIDLGLGLAAHDGEIDDEAGDDRSQLGSALLFRLSFEAGFDLSPHHRLSLLFDHISNGYLADPNEGLDTLGIRYGYWF
ncbi:MAG: acyloxyacyl hydrolase [Desulfofustis sp.]